MKARWNKNWKVKDGHSVKIHYVGTLPDGEEFDSSYSRGETLDFKVGSGKLIKGFNDAVVGMKRGQKKKVTLTPDVAYGNRNEQVIVEVNKTAFPEDFDFRVGGMVHGSSPSGKPVLATILAEQKDTVTLDHNHPLAGKDLTFEIELVEAVKEE
tara:strand:+ start:5045 stop:5506 length:462 start_codon:yes stop_codon:yes gene_type:complete